MNAAIIRWTNKFSGEQGFVGSVSTKNKCFYNADRSGAKLYSSEKAARKAIVMLQGYGEADNNDFEILSAG